MASLQTDKDSFSATDALFIYNTKMHVIVDTKSNPQYFKYHGSTDKTKHSGLSSHSSRAI
jgi:hypothetical protein